MKFTLKTILSATPEEVYNTWLNSEGHSQMTGGIATASDKVGDEYTAWDGYINGKNIELEKNKRIVQTWRSTQFNELEEDSIIDISLKEVNNETEFTIIHSKIPESGEHYKRGWEEHYFKPMKSFFSSK